MHYRRKCLDAAQAAGRLLPHRHVSVVIFIFAVMHPASFIRSLYHPRQPMAGTGDGGVLYYREVPPGALLRPFIYCFWELRTNRLPDHPFQYRVVADGCIDLIIDTHSYNGMYVAGVSDTSFDVPLSGAQSYFGIRFLPGSIHSFFSMPLDSIRNLMAPADEVTGTEANELAQLVYEENDFSDRINAAEQYLLKRHSSGSSGSSVMHPGLACALHHILQTGGNLPIQKKAADWISPRQLRRLFHEQIGCHPKLFSRIVRFQRVLGDMQAGRSYSCYHHGYFDQAHFIRDFKTFSGVTPSVLGRLRSMQ